MKGLAPLFLGIFGTFAFSWLGMTVIPNWQIGNLNPQSDESLRLVLQEPSGNGVRNAAGGNENVDPAARAQAIGNLGSNVAIGGQMEERHRRFANIISHEQTAVI